MMCMSTIRRSDVAASCDVSVSNIMQQISCIKTVNTHKYKYPVILELFGELKYYIVLLYFLLI